MPTKLNELNRLNELSSGKLIELICKAVISTVEDDAKLKYLKNLCSISKVFREHLAGANLLTNLPFTTTLTLFKNKAECLRPNLTFLRLSDQIQHQHRQTGALKESFENVLQHSNIRELQLFSEKSDYLNVAIKLLETNIMITVLKLRCIGMLMSDDCRATMRSFLQRNKAVTKLDLSHNFIDAESMESLVESLTFNRTITELDLSCNSLSYGNSTTTVADLFNQDSTIAALNLSRCRLDSDSLERLAKALDGNTTLTKLDLSENYLSYSLPAGVCGTLCTNNAIMTLNLSSSHIDASQMKSLVESLKNNRTLTELNLSSNPIDAWQMKSLVESLKNNRTLRKLDLYKTGLLGFHINTLVESLAVNETLIELNLSNNDLPPAATNAIAQILGRNSFIKKLSIGGNDIPLVVAKNIARAAVERRGNGMPIELDSHALGNRSASSYWSAFFYGLRTGIWRRSDSTTIIKNSLIAPTLTGIGFGVSNAMSLWPFMTCGKALAILFSVGIAVTTCANVVLYVVPLLLVVNIFFGLADDAYSANYGQRLRMFKKDMWFNASIAIGAFLGLIGTFVVIGKFSVPIINFIYAGHILSIGGRELLFLFTHFAVAGAGMLIGGLILALVFLAINKRNNQVFDKAIARINGNNSDSTVSAKKSTPN